MQSSSPRTIAIIGNPNSGKTSLFNALTGLNQKVGNFPGVTVERKSADLTLPGGEQAILVDVPGTYSLYPTADDERTACEILRSHEHPDHPDVLIVVADATQLKRSLLLATQCIDLGIPVVVAVNMVDMLEADGAIFKHETLAKRLGVPVVPTSARKARGIQELKNTLAAQIKPARSIMAVPQGFAPMLSRLKAELRTENDYLAYQALLRPEEFTQLAPELGRQLQAEASISSPDDLISNEMLVRYDRIDGILEGVLVQNPSAAESRTQRIDNVLLHRVWGYGIFMLVLLVVFQAIFSWAEYPMNLIEDSFGATGEWLKNMLPDMWWARLFVDGIWAGIGGIIVFVPQIALMALFISLLEESGYMSRVIFLMDRLMRPFGFSGRAMVPLIGGMACAIPAVMATRSIPNAKERLIAILVTPLMSCSARLPVYILLIGLFVPDTPVFGFFTLQGVTMLGLYVLGFCMALVAAAVFKGVLKHRQDGVFVVELPVYRQPRWKNLGINVYQKCSAFVVGAGKIIILISVVLWAMASYAPGNRMAEIDAHYAQLKAQPNADIAALDRMRESAQLQASYAGVVGKAIEPAIAPLGFDWKIGISLLTSFAAREVFVGTMATLYSADDAEENPEGLRAKMRAERNPETGKPTYTPAVAFALLVFYAFAMQCMSTLAIVRRETGAWKWVWVMLIYLTALAYGAAWITYQIAG